MSERVEDEDEPEGSDRNGCLRDVAEGIGCCAVEAAAAAVILAGLVLTPVYLLK